ncbi:MAG: NACHT domain-containing protein [Propionibacteriaceae bacterium]|nr:NACHT domain-containing protein [Propionibacteriaceae bacterium]
MASSSSISSLVAAAIHLFSGNSGGVTTSLINAGWPTMQEAFRPTLEAKRLRQDVRKAIHEWAEGDNVANADIDTGLEIAKASIEQFGFSKKELEECGLNAENAASRVILAASSREPSWSLQRAEFNVAEHAIRATYAALIRACLSEPGYLEARFREIESELALLRVAFARLSRIPAQVNPNNSDIMRAIRIYLNARIIDWNALPDWLGGRSLSSLARPLVLRSPFEPGSPDKNEIDALEGAQMMVVVGEPGSGKTWLSKRYALVAARKAIAALDEGKPLSEVEIPIWTTWAAWKDTPGPTRESLVRASFDRVMAVGSLTDEDQGFDNLIQRVLSQAGKALVLVDSLDEGPIGNDRDALATSLTTLPGQKWRVVITSRPGAWSATNLNRSDRAAPIRMTEIQPLAWPDDVEVFVGDWFGRDRDNATKLLHQIRARDDLQRVSVSPMLLTFLCLLGPTSAAFPPKRFDLFEEVARRILSAPWRRVETSTDVQSCLAQLTQWAWSIAASAQPTATTNCHHYRTTYMER